MHKIYPYPKMVLYKDGHFVIPCEWKIFFNSNLANVFSRLRADLDFNVVEKEDANILYLLDEKLGKEAYRIIIDDSKIIIYYHYSAGAYYATETLMQILSHSQIKQLELFDEPDLEIRGFMLDISRDKIPKLETIYELIDMMGLLKMNHLELYVEGFSFGYPSFSRYWQDETPITVEDYLRIEAYANSKHIDLVPNQNGFGHMAPWLALEEFEDLAECPEGIFLWGTHREPSTLNPLDPKSIELIQKMYVDMLSISNSKYFNMNFDEPFELGKGKSKEECEKKGLGNVYVDFVLKVYDEVKKYNKTPLIWGDVLLKHPEVLARLPKDMIFIDWGYDGSYPFSENLKLISEQNIKFLSAPGTSSWSSFAGRTSDSLPNIYNACVYTKLYGGLGSILTDWGDFGHLQYWPISLVPLSYFGLLSWRVSEKNYYDLKHFCNKYIFKDANNLMTDILLDLGSYNKYENMYASNGTQTFYTLLWSNYALKEDNPLAYFENMIRYSKLSLKQFHLMQKHFDDILYRLEQVNMAREDSKLIYEEIVQTINLIKAIQKLNIAFNDSISIDIRIRYLHESISSSADILEVHKDLWLKRNRVGGLDRSLDRIQKMNKFSRIKLKDLNSRGEDDAKRGNNQN